MASFLQDLYVDLIIKIISLPSQPGSRVYLLHNHTAKWMKYYVSGQVKYGLHVQGQYLGTNEGSVCFRSLASLIKKSFTASVHCISLDWICGVHPSFWGELCQEMDYFIPHSLDFFLFYSHSVIIRVTGCVTSVPPLCLPQ